MTKRIQASSKLVECTTCGVMVHARGLHGHMKLKHGINLITMTRVKPNDSSHSMLTRVKNGTDLSQLVKPRTPIKPFFPGFEDTETKWWSSSHGYRIPRIENCYKCNSRIELQVPVKSQEWFGREPRKVVCDYCIRNFYGSAHCLLAHDKYNKFGEEVYWLYLWRTLR